MDLMGLLCLSEGLKVMWEQTICLCTGGRIHAERRAIAEALKQDLPFILEEQPGHLCGWRQGAQGREVGVKVRD